MNKFLYKFDDFLPQNDAVTLFQKFFDDKKWLPNWNKTVDEHGFYNSIWSKPIGNTSHLSDVEEVDVAALDDHFRILAESSLAKIEEIFGYRHKIMRMYGGSATYGMDGHVHVDDGTVTALYYPNLDWDANWEGGTIFYNDEISDAVNYTTCRFNRLCIFDPTIPHRHMGVSRNCFRLRMIIVMKCVPDYNDTRYAEKFS